MDFLKIKLFFIILLFLPLSFGRINAQNNITQGDLRNAFKESYNLEAKWQYSEAIETLKNYYDPKSYEINLRLGWLHYLNKQYSESINYYQNAIDLMPNSIEAKFGYINPEAALEDWVKVAAQYDAILKIDPQNTAANYRMGIIYYYRPDYNNAFKCFEKVVNLYPFDYDGLLMYAWTYYQLGKYKEAEIFFNKVLLLKPFDDSALQGLNLLKGK